MSDLGPARLTTGELYSGNQRFAGTGVMKSCNACGKHRPSTEGWKRGICPDCLKLKAILPASVRKAEKRAAKAEGPWTQPGYSFQLPDWPPGFVSQMAEPTASEIGAASASKALTARLEDPAIRAKHQLQLTEA